MSRQAKTGLDRSRHVTAVQVCIMPWTVTVGEIIIAMDKNMFMLYEYIT